MDFIFENTRPEMSDDEIIADLRRVASDRNVVTVTVRAYNHSGRFSAATVKSRFGTWNAALKVAGLAVVSVRALPDAMLWDNLREVWIRLGRQPRRTEMRPPVSALTHAPYVRSFGSWLDALKAFVAEHHDGAEAPPARRLAAAQRALGPRDPSLRLRYLVMRRDDFRCRICGRSPATDTGIQLHLDHMTPWARGGRTEASNLQTLCQNCNLGKADLAPH